MFLTTITKSLLRPVSCLLRSQNEVQLPAKMLVNSKLDISQFRMPHYVETDLFKGPCRAPKKLRRDFGGAAQLRKNQKSTQRRLIDILKRYQVEEGNGNLNTGNNRCSTNLQYLLKMGQTLNNKGFGFSPNTDVLYVNNYFLQRRLSANCLLCPRKLQRAIARQKTSGNDYPGMKCLPKNWERHPDDCRPCCKYPTPWNRKRIIPESTVHPCPCEPHTRRVMKFRPPCGPGSMPINRRIPKCCPNLLKRDPCKDPPKPCYKLNIPKPFCKATAFKCRVETCPKECRVEDEKPCPPKDPCKKPLRLKHRAVGDPQPPCIFKRKLKKPACIGCGETCIPYDPCKKRKPKCKPKECLTGLYTKRYVKNTSSLVTPGLRKTPRAFSLMPSSAPALPKYRKSFAEKLLEECNFKLFTSRIIESDEDFPSAKGYFQKLSMSSMQEDSETKKPEPALVLFKRSLFDNGILRPRLP